MTVRDFGQFFERATGYPPYPYQNVLGTMHDFPSLLAVPTGAGKTARGRCQVGRVRAPSTCTSSDSRLRAWTRDAVPSSVSNPVARRRDWKPRHTPAKVLHVFSRRLVATGTFYRASGPRATGRSPFFSTAATMISTTFSSTATWAGSFPTQKTWPCSAFWRPLSAPTLRLGKSTRHGTSDWSRNAVVMGAPASSRHVASQEGK